MIAHPAEIKTVMRNDKSLPADKYVTLSVEQYLSKIEEASENGYTPSPLKLFSKKSVFRLTLYYGDVKVYANIPVYDLAKVDMRTKACTKILMESEGCSGKSAAYTTLIKVGSFKNRTPAQVLLSNPGNKEGLMRTAGWLKDNQGRNAGNMEQYNAIMEAISLQDNGGLKDAGRQVYKIFDAPVRSHTRKKRNSDGKTFVNSMQITCCPQNNYPYQVSISNFYADVKGVQIISGTISDKVGADIYLTEQEWDDIVEQMKIVKQLFVQYYGAYEYKRAEEAMNRLKKND